MKDDTVLLKKRKRRFGDRYDGYRVRKLDVPFWIIPNVMRTRTDSQIFFEEKINIGELERYTRRKRSDDIQSLKTVHVIIAAMVRTFAMKPRLNRFIAGKKIFSHNNLRFSMTIKRQMTADGAETEILPCFEPTDTIYDVVRRFNAALESSRDENGDGHNDTDKWQNRFIYIPTWLKTFVVFLVRNLDKIGLMPKSIYRASPFHSSAYITDVGSLGIDSVYHHLYDFGTTSCFIAVGKKQLEPFVREDGSLGQRKVMNIKFTLDERVCDGFYYAGAIKYFKSLIKHPERLEETVSFEDLPDDM